MFMMRFAMRANTASGTERADLYHALVEMCAWGESHGCIAATLSEHHGSEDGYLPSPVPVDNFAGRQVVVHRGPDDYGTGEQGKDYRMQDEGEVSTS